jgi:23S rRNA (adenine2503-C2)-methyltransferase
MNDSIKNMDYAEIQDWALDKGLKPFVGRQLFEWIFGKNVGSPGEMSNISLPVRTMVEKQGPFLLLELHDRRISHTDGSEKFLFRCRDGHKLETVLIPSAGRNTLCVSSQIGCAMGCGFCRTAEMGFVRDLSSGEIVEQFLTVKRISGKNITHVVFMGMGEPFNNYHAVLKAARILNHEKGPHIAARRITLSTCGIVPRIRDLAHDPAQFKLAVSLNAASDEKRNMLMPVNRAYPLKELLAAVKYFTDTTHKLVTFEYVLMRDVNDGNEDARLLAEKLRSIPCKLNIIPYNETGGHFRRPDDARVALFISRLGDTHFPVTLRKSGGQDIAAACGQLYAQECKV